MMASSGFAGMMAAACGRMSSSGFAGMMASSVSGLCGTTVTVVPSSLASSAARVDVRVDRRTAGRTAGVTGGGLYFDAFPLFFELEPLGPDPRVNFLVLVVGTTPVSEEEEEEPLN